MARVRFISAYTKCNRHTSHKEYSIAENAVFGCFIGFVEFLFILSTRISAMTLADMSWTSSSTTKFPLSVSASNQTTIEVNTTSFQIANSINNCTCLRLCYDVSDLLNDQSPSNLCNLWMVQIYVQKSQQARTLETNWEVQLWYVWTNMGQDSRVETKRWVCRSPSCLLIWTMSKRREICPARGNNSSIKTLCIRLEAQLKKKKRGQTFWAIAWTWCF